MPNRQPGNEPRSADAVSSRMVVETKFDPMTQAAIDAIADNITELRGVMGDLQETMTQMHAARPTELSTAVVSGLTQVLKDDELMDEVLLRLLGAFGKYATKRTGTWTLDQLRAIPGKLIVWGLVIAILWQMGGLGAVLKFLTAMTKTGP